MIEFLKWAQLNEADRKNVEKIFFETAAIQSFNDNAVKEKFRYKYFGYYVEHDSELIYVAKEGELVLGYICGSPDTSDVYDLFKFQPHLALFNDLYLNYPAHLHINLTKNAQGKGVGSMLLKIFEQEINKLGVPGIHLITTKSSRNVHFYEKNGYLDCFERTKDHIGPLYFMGKLLNG